MIEVRHREKHYERLDLAIAAAFGLIGNLFAFLSYSFSDPVQRNWFVGSTLFVAVAFGVLCYIARRRLRSFWRLRVFFLNNAKLIRGLLNSMRICHDIMAYPGNSWSRDRLAQELAEMSNSYYRSYSTPAYLYSSRSYKREHRRHVLKLAASFESQKYTARHGSPDQIFALRDALGRALLQISAGDWMAIGTFADPNADLGQFLRPSVIDYLTGSNRAPLIIALLTLLTAGLTLLAKLIT